MSDLRARVSAAWHQAAKDLGFRFTSPFPAVRDDGSSIDCLGLVHGFGQSFGTLLFLAGEAPMPRREEVGEEYYYSELTEMYAVYERGLFAETLDDWGYFGPESQKPSWYTGKVWGANAG